jgi:hypothetical protein
VFKEAVSGMRNADFGLRIEETEETNAR